MFFVSKWRCAYTGCLAAMHGVDDVPLSEVLKIASPGWRWDGVRLWCPHHGKVH